MRMARHVASFTLSIRPFTAVAYLGLPSGVEVRRPHRGSVECRGTLHCRADMLRLVPGAQMCMIMLGACHGTEQSQQQHIEDCQTVHYLSKPATALGAQVCLSLLGTWHGTNETQKWHPDTANLWRVLVSIQGMILIGDPYFNEPNVRSWPPPSFTTAFQPSASVSSSSCS